MVLEDLLFWYSQGWLLCFLNSGFVPGAIDNDLDVRFPMIGPSPKVLDCSSSIMSTLKRSPSIPIFSDCLVPSIVSFYPSRDSSSISESLLSLSFRAKCSSKNYYLLLSTFCLNSSYVWANSTSPISSSSAHSCLWITSCTFSAGLFYESIGVFYLGFTSLTGTSKSL